MRPTTLYRLTFIAICVTGFFLRLQVATHMSWLYDEIVYVKWLGEWFSANAFSYVFQLWHTTYPPSSPYFANPPLPMLFYGMAIDLGRPFHMDPLLAARLVNVCFGTALIALVYRFASLWLAAPGRLMAAFFCATSPVLVALGGSSYQETVAAFFGLLALYLIVSRSDALTLVRLGVICLVTALAMLCKLTNLYVFFGVTALAIIAAARGRLRMAYAAAVPFAVVAIAAILWAGARDPHHIAGVIHYVTAARPADHLGPEYPRGEKPLYYALMIFGTMPSAMAAFLIVGLAFLIATALKQRRWTPAAIWIASTAVVVCTLPYLVAMSTRHEIALPLCAVAILTGFSADALWRRMQDGGRALGLATLAVASASVFAMPPGLINTFNNALVGRLDADRLYSSGDGAGLDLVAAWVNANTQRNAVISSTASYALAEYLRDGRTVRAIFTNSRPAEIDGTACLVIPHPYLASAHTELQDTARAYRLVAQIPSSAYPLYSIYSTGVAIGDVLPITAAFTAQFVDATPSQTSHPLAYRGTIDSNGYAAFVSGAEPLRGDALQIRLHRNAGELVYVDLMNYTGSEWLRSVIPTNGPLDGTFVIRYRDMTAPGTTAPAFFQRLHGAPVRLRIAIDAQGRKRRYAAIGIVSSAMVTELRG